MDNLNTGETKGVIGKRDLDYSKVEPTELTAAPGSH
jgi:hypothetical protein